MLESETTNAIGDAKNTRKTIMFNCLLLVRTAVNRLSELSFIILLGINNVARTVVFRGRLIPRLSRECRGLSRSGLFVLYLQHKLPPIGPIDLKVSNGLFFHSDIIYFCDAHPVFEITGAPTETTTAFNLGVK